MEVRSFSTFAELIAGALDLGSVPDRGDRLGPDLSLDSLAMFELFVILDDIGVPLDSETLVSSDLTIGALYDRLVLAIVDDNVANRQRGVI